MNLDNYSSKKDSIVTDNKLLDYPYTLNMSELKLLMLALSKSWSKGEKATVSLKPSEFISALNLKCDVYEARRVILRTMKSINTKPIIRECKDSGKQLERFWLSGLSTPTQEAADEPVIIDFNPEISDLLFDLSSAFTSVDFISSIKLTSVPAFRIYQWIHRYAGINKKPKGVFTIELSDLRKSLRLGKYHDRWAELNRHLVTPAINELKKETKKIKGFSTNKTKRAITSINIEYDLTKGFIPVDAKSQASKGKVEEISQKKPTKKPVAKQEKETPELEAKKYLSTPHAAGNPAIVGIDKAIEYLTISGLSPEAQAIAAESLGAQY